MIIRSNKSSGEFQLLSNALSDCFTQPEIMTEFTGKTPLILSLYGDKFSGKTSFISDLLIQTSHFDNELVRGEENNAILQSDDYVCFHADFGPHIINFRECYEYDGSSAATDHCPLKTDFKSVCEETTKKRGLAIWEHPSAKALNNSHFMIVMHTGSMNSEMYLSNLSDYLAIEKGKNVRKAAAALDSSYTELLGDNNEKSFLMSIHPLSKIPAVTQIYKHIKNSLA